MYGRFPAWRCVALVTALVLWPCVARAALPVDLEVAVVQAAPLGAMQEWGKLLNGLDLARVRLRGAHNGDKPSITPVGQGQQQRFRVLGVLNNRDQLILQGGAFGRGDIAKLKAFLEGLPEQAAEQGVERGIFGLTKPQFEEAFDDLSEVVAAPTKGVSPAALLGDWRRNLKTPIEFDAAAAAALDRAPPVSAELQGFSLGTALAMVLRPSGLALMPVEPRGNPLVLRIMLMEPNQEYWPAGWKPEKSSGQVAPGMYRFTTVEINGFTLAQALDAFAPHMSVPLFFDEQVLAGRAIDPAKIVVKFPKGKTYIRRAVDHILSQAHLVGELREDEAGKAFYWITQFGAGNLPSK